MRHLPGPAARLCEVRGCIWVESADTAIVILLECVSSRKSGSVTEVIKADVAMARVGTVLSDLGVLARLSCCPGGQCLAGRPQEWRGGCSACSGKRQPAGVASVQPLCTLDVWFSWSRRHSVPSCTSWNTELPHGLSFLSSARTELK